MGQSSEHRAISAWSNPVKKALREGKVCVGFAGLAFSCPAAAQISAEAGYSFYYFDMEHSGLSIESVESICTASKLAGITPIGGSSGIADFLISRLLDNGAMGVIAPHVSTPEETEIVVNACRYPPVGTRGFVGFGPLTDFHIVDASEWVKTMNREILAAIKVESVQGVQNIEEIVEVAGLDAVLIGTSDLSASMGIPGESDNTGFNQAIERMLDVCNKKGIPCGPHVNSLQELKKWADKGANFMTLNADFQLLLRASKENVDKARAILGDKMF